MNIHFIDKIFTSVFEKKNDILRGIHCRTWEFSNFLITFVFFKVSLDFIIEMGERLG